MFAQAVPTDFWKVIEHIGLLAAIAGNVALIIAYKRKEVRRIEPQPFEVRMFSELAREKDCLERHGSAERQLQELRSLRHNDEKVASISRKAIYEQIRKSEEKTGAVVDSVRRELSDKIDIMPDRIIATLRNVGAIGGK